MRSHARSSFAVSRQRVETPAARARSSGFDSWARTAPTSPGELSTRCQAAAASIEILLPSAAATASVAVSPPPWVYVDVIRSLRPSRPASLSLSLSLSLCAQLFSRKHRRRAATLQTSLLHAGRPGELEVQGRLVHVRPCSTKVTVRQEHADGFQKVVPSALQHPRRDRDDDSSNRSDFADQTSFS